MNKVAVGILLAGCLISAGATRAVAHPGSPSLAQVVALDECDPATFNDPAVAGPDFCRNVALGAQTTFANLVAEAAAGNPDANWDFEPDSLVIEQGTILSVVDQGGEPHTFTEVAKYGADSYQLSMRQVRQRFRSVQAGSPRSR
jgi:hypothetical protein